MLLIFFWFIGDLDNYTKHSSRTLSENQFVWKGENVAK